MAAIYVLDANVFIEAARRYYAFDIVPSFWETLIDYADGGLIQSIDRVKDELLRGNDDLANWASKEFSQWFAPTDDPSVIDSYRDIMIWVHSQGQFTSSARASFASAADGWLVAYAKAYGHIVVTHEQFDPNSRKRVPIPNVCRAFGVSVVDTFAMLRALGIRLG